MTDKEVKDYCSTIEKAIDKFDAKLDKLSERYDDISCRLTAVETNQANMQADITEIRNGKSVDSTNKENRNGLLINGIIIAIVTAIINLIILVVK
jgi:predicted  nucleic acid-binding Zn-ribbon protein